MNDRTAVRYGALRGGHAIVIGASTTGLAASAAAARHFAHVTTIERDSLPDDPVWRKGVPQSRHTHLLLRSGQNVFNDYFPGLTTAMLEDGAVEVDVAKDICWYHAGGWKKRFESGFTMQCQSKGYLEWCLRRRLEQFPHVSIRQNCRVESLIEDKGRITGVRLAGGETLHADLVIDASGRSSQTPQDLRDLGFGVPAITDLKVDIGYSSCTFRPSESASRDWKAMLIHSRPPATRTAALLPIEDGRWTCTLVGWQGDHPGGDLESYLAWARGMPVPDLYQALRRAEPLEPVWRWRFPSNLRRHYERMETMPDGLVVVGDANTSMNPIYAQGMSQGAVGASILDACLREQRRTKGEGRIDGLGRRFHAAYSKFLDECWFTSTAEDYGATDDGVRPWMARLTSWYLGKVTEMTWHDAGVARAFIDVMHMQKSPTSLMRPSMLLKAVSSRPNATSPGPAQASA